MSRSAKPVVASAAEIVLPFGLTWDNPVFRRARSMALALFDGYDASIVLMKDGKIWRSSDPEGKLNEEASLSLHVIRSGKPLWVSDLPSHPHWKNTPWIAGPPYLKFYGGVPIALPDGSFFGAMSVAGIGTPPDNPRLMARLADLATMVADECERARLNAALAEGHRQLRQTRTALEGFVKLVPGAVMMTDREMRIVEASPKWLGDFDLTSIDQARGKTVYELHPGFFERFRHAYERVLGGETISSERVKSVQPDGSVHWLSSEMCPWYNDDGEIGGLIGIATNITPLVEALRRSEQAEERMNLAAEIADLHVWELDFVREELVQGGQTLNTEEEFFGRKLTYADLYMNTSATIHPEDRPGIEKEWTKATLEGRRYVPEYRLARDDDKEVWAACGVKLITNKAGQPLRLIGAMQNITARKQAELALIQARDDAEAANKAKSAFLATMSHEIRTPLNGVIGMAQAMAGDDLTGSQRDRLSIIRESGETLLAILNDVLDLSKIEAGKLDLEVAEFDLGDLARGAHATFTEIANRKGLSFNLSVEDSARGTYLGDSTRLRQILYNLVSNALKFTERGEVKVTFARADGELTMRVKDTGIGVEADRLAKLFGKFEQADASTTRRYGGTGLGLSICRDLVDLMGGRIDAESTIGEGTVFEAVLPLERVGEARVPNAETVAVSSTAAVDASELRVLAAEDNSVNQLVLRTLLHQADIEVTIVGNGRLAVEAWQAQDWDVILMDVQMPEMDGPSATAAIRAEEAKSGRAHTPIIALTANAMAHQVAEYRAAGMDDFCSKPIEITQLFAAMERVLDGPGEEQEAIAS